MDPIERLTKGNERFMNGTSPDTLSQHLSGQSPFAAVLTCADSRVIPEKIFDLDIGEIFVVRVAGNVAIDPSVLGSLEYTVEHLKVPLMLVLGHTCCGAIAAAGARGEVQGNVGPIISEIRCCFGSDDDVRANVLRQVRMLPERSKMIKQAMGARLTLGGAIYHLDDGRVELL